MNFDELNKQIPYARYGKEKVLRMEPYPGIVLAMPGRHAEDTTPKGGDFCVMVTSKEKGWKEHQFTHTDLFKDVENRLLSSINGGLMEAYLDVITGSDPDLAYYGANHAGIGDTLRSNVFLHAVQCLAIAEHRRYARYEAKFGGRFLPFRFAAGIHEQLWTATDAAEKQRRGRPGVEWLEKDHGRPVLTQKLMDK